MIDSTAASAAAPAVAAADDETPAPPPEPTPQELVALIETRLGGKLTETEKHLLEEVGKAHEAARRAQSAADSNATRLKRDYDRRFARLESLATRGLSEDELRIYRAETQVADMEARRDTDDAEERDKKAREDFAAYSAALLAEEGIKADDPVLTEAFRRFASDAKDPSDWKASLARAIAVVRKSEAAKAVEDERKKGAEAVEQERAKARNARREGAGPIDAGQPGARGGGKKVEDMTDEEFAVYSDQRAADRERRRMEAIR